MLQIEILSLKRCPDFHMGIHHGGGNVFDCSFYHDDIIDQLVDAAEQLVVTAIESPAWGRRVFPTTFHCETGRDLSVYCATMLYERLRKRYPEAEFRLHHKELRQRIGYVMA